MTTQEKLMTAEELFLLPDDGMEHELVRGELRTMPPPGFRHEEIALQVALQLGGFVKAHRLGRAVGGPGFRLERHPDTVRAPDFAFIAAGRLPAGPPPIAYPDLAPDLVVEVVSPGDTATEVQAKIEEWLRAGVRLALVLFPDTRSVAAYRNANDIRLLGPDDVLEIGDVLPGFTCQVRELFPE